MPPGPPPLAFSRALDTFRSSLAAEDAEDFKHTKLEDLQRFIRDVQDKQGRKTQNLARLTPFLEGMEQYGKIIEVFLNASGVIAFVWGPTKFVLQVASNYVEAFDELLDVYRDIGESLPILTQYESLFKENPYMGKVLELIYVDILDFNRKAYKYFKQRVWKQLFRATWKSFRSHFGLLIANLRRHKHLVETQASIAQFEEIQQIRLQAEIEFRNIRKAEELRRRSEVLEWLSPANVAEDQELKARARGEYPGVCNWILEHDDIQRWRESLDWSDPRSLLWIHGIPGAGKSTAASFLIEELQKIPSATTLFFYCKHEDNERNSFIALARAFIAQAVRHDEILLSYVYEEAAKSGERPLKTKKGAEDILEVALKSLGQAYIVIDGLDECKVSEKSTITSWFKNAVNGEPEDSSMHIRCLFMSQVDKETSKLLKFVPQLSIGQDGLTRDIRAFCEIEGAKIKRKFELSESECDEIIKKVADEAQGMFLYAKLVMKNLLDQTRRASLRKELQPGTFPQGIDKAYGRIVDRILFCSELSQSERDDAKQLLGLLLCVKRPLKWLEVQGAVSIDLESQEVDIEGRRFRVDSKDLCGSLVEINPGGTVDLVHMTAKQYLVNQSHLSVNAEELALSRLCLEYLSFKCFDNGLPDHAIQQFVMTGHYIFADYAISYWAEHLLGVIKSNNNEDLSSLHIVIESLLKHHINPEAHKTIAAIEKTMDRPELGEYRHDFGQIVATLNKDLDLKQVLRQIRCIIERLYGLEEMKGSLEILYGCQLFKCPRVDCNRFFEGFEGSDARHQHEKKHDRPFYCTFESCPAAQSGFTDSVQLEQHISRIHDPFGLFQCSENRNSAEDKIEQAIKSSDFMLLEQYLKNENELFSSGSDWKWSNLSSKWWLTAMRQHDDDIINILTFRTSFSGSSAQYAILDLAIKEERHDLVQRFCQEEFFNPKTPFTPLAMLALKNDSLDALQPVLRIQHTLRSLTRLRDTAVKASRCGALVCLQYLVLEHQIDPFEHNNSHKAKRQGTHEEFRRHSILYNAVETSQTAICRFILSTEEQNIFKFESIDILMDLAARSGHDRILEILLERSDRADMLSFDRYVSRAKLYNAMRHGRKEIVESLLYLELPKLDGPDVNGCSLLMYAALHGFLEVVEFLIAKGADVNRKGNCPEITASTGRRQTSLLMAVYNGHDIVVRRLLQCDGIELSSFLTFRKGGIIVKTKYIFGRWSHIKNIHKVAKERGFPAIVKMLEEHERSKKSL